LSEDQVPDDVRRFLLSGVLTVPHVEAILQLRAERNRAWDADRLATRLYVRAGVAQQVLADLNAIGIAAAEGQPPTYRYAPATAELLTGIPLAESNVEAELTTGHSYLRNHGRGARGRR